MKRADMQTLHYARVSQFQEQPGASLRKFSVRGNVNEVVKTATAPLGNGVPLHQTCVLSLHFNSESPPALVTWTPVRAERWGRATAVRSDSSPSHLSRWPLHIRAEEHCWGKKRWSRMQRCLCGALSVNRQRVSGDRITDYDSFRQMTLPWTFSKESRTTTHTSTHVSSDSINEDVLDMISPRLSHCCLLCFDPPYFSPHILIRHYLRSEIRTRITLGALGQLLEHLLHAE